MLRILLLIAIATCVLAQESDVAADIHDSAVIEVTLYRSVTAEEIHRSPQEYVRQAQELVDAANRRLQRQEAKMNAAIARGASVEELAELRAEFDRRLGIAYDALSRAEVLRQIARSAASRKKVTSGRSVIKYAGNGYFTDVDQMIVAKAYQRRFGRPLPISAQGETLTHRAMGFDHTGRLDVALSPDQAEGMWLCSFLRSMGIPFYGFRGAIAGKATGAHIHIGPASERIPRGTAVMKSAKGS